MSRKEFSKLIREDLFRYDSGRGAGAFLWAWRHEAGFRFTFLMRLTRLLHCHALTRYGFYHLAAFLYHRCRVRHGVCINFTSEVGGGLYLPHALNIVVNRECRIGRNCNLSQGVTLGAAYRGERVGCPSLGDRVYVAPGAVIFGAIHLGNDVAVGANCLVTKDVSVKAVVVGVPGKIISHEGSTGYVNRVLDSEPESQES